MPHKAILLVMDMINDLVHDDGPNGKAGLGPQVRARNIIANTRAAIARARSAGLPVGYVRVGFSPGYGEAWPDSPVFKRAIDNKLYQLGSWGTEVHPELAPQPGDFDIVKHRVSPFYATKLEPILRAHRIETLYLCGVSSNGVLQLAAREGHDRDYRCVILEDCCTAATPEEHASAITLLSRVATLATSETVTFD